MSPQRSNRANLIEGTLRCLERLPAERVTARVIAEEAGANLASITYHFGSKDELVTAAVIEGLDRWLVEVAEGLAGLPGSEPVARFRKGWEMIEETRRRHVGLATNFVQALAKAQHDSRIRTRLAEGFHRSRQAVAVLFGLGADEAGSDAAGLVLAMFDGLLFQMLLDPTLAVEGERMGDAQARLRHLLPE